MSFLEKLKLVRAEAGGHLDPPCPKLAAAFAVARPSPRPQLCIQWPHTSASVAVKHVQQSGDTVSPASS